MTQWACFPEREERGVTASKLYKRTSGETFGFTDTGIFLIPVRHTTFVVTTKTNNCSRNCKHHLSGRIRTICKLPEDRGDYPSPYTVYDDISSYKHITKQSRFFWRFPYLSREEERGSVIKEGKDKKGSQLPGEKRKRTFYSRKKNTSCRAKTEKGVLLSPEGDQRRK